MHLYFINLLSLFLFIRHAWGWTTGVSEWKHQQSESFIALCTQQHVGILDPVHSLVLPWSSPPFPSSFALNCSVRRYYVTCQNQALYKSSHEHKKGRRQNESKLKQENKSKQYDRIWIYLISTQFVSCEVNTLRVCQVNPGNRRCWLHGQGVGQCDANLIWSHQLPHGQLFWVVRLAGVASCWPNTLTEKKGMAKWALSQHNSLYLSVLAFKSIK